MEFKDRFRELRQKNNITVQDIAKTLGKSESAIRMWETDKSKPDADTLMILAKYFDCSTDFLLGLSDYSKNVDKVEIEGTLKNASENLESIDDKEVLRLIVETIEGLTISFARMWREEDDTRLKFIHNVRTVILNFEMVSTFHEGLTLYSCGNEQGRRAKNGKSYEEIIENLLNSYKEFHIAAMSSLVRIEKNALGRYKIVVPQSKNKFDPLRGISDALRKRMEDE